MSEGVLWVVLVVAFIAVSWLIHFVINNVFGVGEKALRNRRQDSEAERIRQHVQRQRRSTDE
jgi:hypothetical protein